MIVKKPSDIQVSITLDRLFDETPGELYTDVYLGVRVTQILEVVPDQFERVMALVKTLLNQYTGQKDQGYSFGMTHVTPDPDYPEDVETRYFSWRHKQ